MSRNTSDNPATGEFDNFGSLDDPDTNVSPGFAPSSGATGVDSSAGTHHTMSDAQPKKGEFVSGAFELTEGQIPHARETLNRPE